MHFVELGQSPKRPDLTNLLAELSTFIFKSFFILILNLFSVTYEANVCCSCKNPDLKSTKSIMGHPPFRGGEVKHYAKRTLWP